MQTTDILIIGAGAAGLMAARELGKAGKKVIILEARDRIGGRIWPLEKEKFGYEAQGGAEFVHGAAPVTKALLNEAGLTYISSEGEMWSIRNGELTQDSLSMPHEDELHEKLKTLDKDIPIADFLDKNFSDEKYSVLRTMVNRMVEGYDAADPKRISTFSLREEWLGGGDWEQGKIKEGYGALLKFLESECKKNGVEIICNQKVTSVRYSSSEKEKVEVQDEKGNIYTADKIIVTAALPTLQSISFNPAVLEKIEAAAKIGFGNVIKILYTFSSRWWETTLQKNLSKMAFMFSNEKVATWWTQYPEMYPVLTGWIAGPNALKFKDASSEEIVDVGIVSLSNIFNVQKEFLEKELVNSKVINWPADPLTRGAYSYTTPETKQAYRELIKPIDNKIFFAGEAFYKGKETATVEGALSSGLDTAQMILNMK